MRLPCPNKKIIRNENIVSNIFVDPTSDTVGIVDHLMRSETHIPGFLAVVDKFGDDGLEGVIRLRELQRAARRDEMITRIAGDIGDIGCRRCSGPVVDRSSGDVFCGREVPEAVVQINQRLTESI